MAAHPCQPVAVLPPPHGRWTPARKEELVRQVEAGEVELADALARYGVSLEEFGGWKARLARRGRRGLQQHFIGERLHG
jgi:hypothetical protein